ncbi:hypothetical protein GS682_30530 [Nostoc sp. B(2019)]|nr:hypothetical protein [Nostoc sp. B(2019)]
MPGNSVRLWRWRSHRHAGLTAQPFFQNDCLVSKGHKGEAQGFAPLGSDKDHRRKPAHPAGSKLQTSLRL